MEKEKALGYQFRTVSNLVQRYVDTVIASNGIDDLTGVHSWIMRFLVNHENEEVFQKDIEEALEMQRSTVSRVLSRMERNGYIEREIVSHDKRLRKVVATQKAHDADAMIHEALHNAEQVMRTNISDVETNQLLQTIHKIQGNLEQSLEQVLQEKEETD